MFKLLVLLIVTLMTMVEAQQVSNVTCNQPSTSFYDMSFPLLDESANISFTEYQNKVVLIFNVASFDANSNETYLNSNLLMEKFGAESMHADIFDQSFNQ
ncbi:hypothetical protein SAMD00019534_084530 [Acytostelium subglobosum LB1]|uniref:hypothetical protein n=1 Tax=Acytostelium subglobosum LB1 TaxID=1410327 RepID=UPI000644CA28|nr:hypothetical protein SAMD00019534_084530 [Acytostelium subglobosum LB1]GAM25278.1 hypothetical protein SAMD00019534_084530 [Acytostelium subglobosum LB1]|eukprot:XP_012751798.1 hypothetical protein SAMD00019534_084530 [Acytostelium subglobosum LB1]